MPSRLIITAASEAYGPSLLAMLGSLTLNWPNHPPVLVYDLGLEVDTLAALLKHKITVRTVPEFCPHWRQHFTWKGWCWQDAPADQFFYLDAGLIALRPMDEVFAAVDDRGYFAIPNYRCLDDESPQPARRACRVPPDFCRNLPSVAGGIIAFDKTGRFKDLLAEAYQIMLVEENVAATSPLHRHDQAIISLLLHRDASPLLLADAQIYQGWESAHQVPGQKIWVHRRKLDPQDAAVFAAHIVDPGDPFIPPVRAPLKPRGLGARLQRMAEKFRCSLKKRTGQNAAYDGVRR